MFVATSLAIAKNWKQNLWANRSAASAIHTVKEWMAGAHSTAKSQVWYAQ